MHALIDEGGKFLAGRILSETDTSAQIELDSGKRIKAKAQNLMLRFASPAPAELMAQAQAQAEGIELDLAWEFAPEDEFGFADLAREYFSAQADAVLQAAMLMRLHEAPHYFRRAGKGRYRKAPAEIVQQALAAIERKKIQQAQIAEWAAELAAGRCPAPVREQLYRVLFKPDKNGPEYKAVVEATRLTQQPPLALLQRAGAIDNAYQFHWRRFCLEHFPRGTGFAPLPVPALTDDLPVAAVQAFSIDDSLTTEIDDALSLQGLGSGVVTLGIHIAAPGLAITPDSAIDQVARERMSTVYMPGHKVTMLPESVVAAFTLAEGRDCPAVSLYVAMDERTLEIKAHDTRVERVPIAANLRHDQLDALVTAEWLEAASAQALPAGPMADVRPQLAFLWRLARHLKAQREQARGRPEAFSRPDYAFRLLGHDGGEPRGDEQVLISTRRRGAPLDLIVAEAMILANSTWGAWLATLGLPGVYRSQASLAPGVKVRMGTKSAPHAGLGVKSYAWSTSPLRRYVDLVNQWQIVAGARHGMTAALAAPFRAKDAALFGIVSGFESAHAAYNEFQAGIERYWTLRHIQQTGLRELEVTVIRDGQAGGSPLGRADTLPLVLTIMGAGDARRGDRLRVRLGQIDLVALDVAGVVTERLDHTQADAEDEDDSPAAGPIAIAVDVADAGGGPDNPAP